MFVTSNAKEADSGKLSRSWDIRTMDIRDAQKYHDVERLNAVNNAFPRGWRTSEPKQAENTITADPHRCYGRLPITRQLRKACPRLYRGQFQRHPICISTGASVGFHFRCRWMRHPICISTGASVGFHFRCRWMRHPICISTGASVGFNFRCLCQKLSGESKMSGALNLFLF